MSYMIVVAALVAAALIWCLASRREVLAAKTKLHKILSQKRARFSQPPPAPESNSRKMPGGKRRNFGNR